MYSLNHSFKIFSSMWCFRLAWQHRKLNTGSRGQEPRSLPLSYDRSSIMSYNIENDGQFDNNHYLKKCFLLRFMSFLSNFLGQLKPSINRLYLKIFKMIVNY